MRFYFPSRALAAICPLTLATLLRLSTNAATPEPPADAKGSPLENSDVKVFSTARYPDLYKPWTKKAPADVTGTGVIIEGKRILTSAHIVLYASQVQIQA